MDAHNAVLDCQTLRRIRREMGLSLDAVAAKASVSRDTLALAESGGRVSFETVQAVANALALNVADLVSPQLPAEESLPGGGGFPALRVFLCHASGDKGQVRSLHQRLVKDGIDPWLDEKRLLPGQEWQPEIAKAVRTSDIVLVCLSRSSITKSGFVQKEIRVALDVADEKPEGTIFIVPVRLEPCDVPDRLQRWQWLDLFEPGGYTHLLSSLRQWAPNMGQPLALPPIQGALDPPWHREDERQFWKITVSDHPPAKEKIYQAMNRKVVTSNIGGDLLFLSYTIRRYLMEAASEVIDEPCDETLPVWAEDGSMLVGLLLWRRNELVHLNYFDDDVLLGRIVCRAIANAVIGYGGHSEIEDDDRSFTNLRLRNAQGAQSWVTWDDAVSQEKRTWQEGYGFCTACCLTSDDQVVQARVW